VQDGMGLYAIKHGLAYAYISPAVLLAVLLADVVCCRLIKGLHSV
jgi:hypothetical protein